MTIKRQRHRLATCFAVGLLFSTCIPNGSIVGAAFAQSADVSIDSLKVSNGTNSFELKGIVFAGSNLSTDEVTKLLSAGTPSADRTALAARLKATSATIAQITGAPTDEGALSLQGLRAEGVDQGKIARLTVASADISIGKAGAEGTMHSGALTIDDADLTSLLKGLQDGSIASATPKATRMTWNGFDMSVPDKDTPADAPGGNFIKIRLGAMDAQSVYDGDFPQQSSGALRNLVIEFPKASTAAKELSAIGYDRVDLSVSWRGAFNATRKAFMLDDFTVSGAGMGSLGLRAEFGGVDAKALRSPEDRAKAVLGLELASAEVGLTNSGLIDKAMAMFAQQQGKSVDDLKTEWAGMATGLLPSMLGGDPSMRPVASAIASFVRDPKSLAISVKGKSGPVKLTGLNPDDPVSALQAFTVTALANGVAASASAAPAPALSPPAATPAAPSAAPVAPQPARKLTGLDAWNQVVGNSVTGKTDDDEAITEYYLKNGKVKQLIDDETNNGEWTLKGQQICFLYDGDDDDDQECYKLEVVGDIATFIDSDGKGRRYTILKGNPKNL